VNRKSPKCIKRADEGAEALVIVYQMGAAAPMSSPYLQQINHGGVVLCPYFLANFHV
jgi:hypothetical protein